MNNIKALEEAALSVRSLSMDGVQAANSGHPGLPMGCAELGVTLFGEIMNHNPADPSWLNRDRFVLSAGHGSMFLYSLLHLSGYDLPLEELKKFRQLGSKTPGHPEYRYTPGVETTTGPLGAGLSTAVGMAIGETMMASRFNTENEKIIDHFTYVLAGDGCMMEGITSEASSLAGHLGLGKLIAFYDSNKITIEGSTSLAFTEDVAARYEAYGWHVQKGSMYEIESIIAMVESAKKETGKPSLIILSSIIGKGSPNKAGSHSVHGAPLGEEEIKATRNNLGIPEGAAFYISSQATEYFKGQKEKSASKQNTWNGMFDRWATSHADKKALWDAVHADQASFLSKAAFPVYKVGDKVATRVASGKALNAIAAVCPGFIGGSADLAPSNNTAMPGLGDYGKDDRAGRTMHYGVREHAMGAVANGLALYGLKNFCATFLVFADYMRPAIRLAAIMKLPVVYVFTHDSIFVGEDGPTHQPIEHITSLRIIPNVRVLRPADAQETTLAWMMAMERKDGPVALALTRQNLAVFEKADAEWEKTARKGAYVAKDCDGKPDVIFAASGSEVGLAFEAAAKLTGKKVRIVSVISRELLFTQDKIFMNSLFPVGVKVISAEAGVTTGWEKIADASLGIDRFGECGPAELVAAHLGLTADHLVKLANT